MMRSAFYTWIAILALSTTAFAQQPLMSGKYTNTSASRVLKDWTREYAMRFAYDSFELSHCKGDWTFQDMKPGEALQKLLEPCGFAFQLSNGQYLIYRVVTTNPKVLEVQDPLVDEPCRISMQVHEAETGEPIPFAVAQWKLEGSGMTGDQWGVIHLPCSAKSNDTLIFYALGYSPLILPAADFKKGNATKYTVEMIQESGLLPPIVVDEGYRFSIQARGFPRQFIMKPNQSPLRYGLGEQDIFRAVQMMPGVGATMELSQGIYLRGSPLDQTLVVLDDFTIYHADHLFGTFSAVNANAVQNARLNRDMGDARWGGRTAGVLDLVGREGDRTRVQTRLDLGALSSGIAIGGPMDEKGKAVFMMTGRRAFTDFFYSNTYKKLFNTMYSSSTKTGVADGFGGSVPPDFSFQDINAKLTYRPSKRDIIHASYYASADQLYVQYADTGSVSVGDYIDARYTDESIKRNNGTSIRWNRAISSTSSFRFSSGYSRFEGSYFSSDTLSNILLANDSIQFSSRIFGLNDWTSRAEWMRNVGNVSDCFGLQFTHLSTQDRTNNRGVRFDTLQMKSSSAAAYWSRLWTFRNWKLQGGGRVTWYEPYRKFYPEPRLNVAYRTMDERLELRSGISRTHQFIQLTTTQNLYGNVPDVWKMAHPKDSPILVMDEFHAGASWKGSHFSCDADFFHKRFRGMATTLLLSSPENTRAFVSNASDGSITGVDGALQYEGREHHVGVSWMWLMSQAHDVDDDLHLHSFVFNHPMEAKLQYEWKHKQWNLSTVYVVGSGRPYTSFAGTYSLPLPDNSTSSIPVFGTPNGAALPAYQRLDIVAIFHWSWNGMRGSICGSVFNVFNHQNIRSRQYYWNPSTPNVYPTGASPRDALMLPRLPTIQLTLEL